MTNTGDPRWFSQTREDVKLDEGCRLRAYWDDIGKCWTIGWGHTGREVIEGLYWTQEQCDDALDNDLNDAVLDATRVVTSFKGLDNVRKGVILNMVFNLGRDRFSQFHKMIDAVNHADYKTAALEMLNSRWAAQVKRRAIKLARRMQQGVI